MADQSETVLLLLGKIEGQVSTVLSQQAHLMTSIKTVDDKYEKKVEIIETRITSLEKAKYWLVGAAVSIAYVAQNAAEWFFKKGM